MLGKGPIDDVNVSIGEPEKSSVLSLHCNGGNTYLYVNELKSRVKKLGLKVLTRSYYFNLRSVS